MAWTAPRTWTSEELITASIMNVHIRDNLLEIEGAKPTTAGDTVHGSGLNALTRLAAGGAGALYRTAAAATAPSWLSRDDAYPWLIHINPLDAAHSNTNFSTNSSAESNSYIGRDIAASGAQNAERAWYVVLAQGTWAITVIHTKDLDHGIYSVQIDTVEVGTVDGYNGSAQTNQYGTVAGVTVASTGKKELKLKLATKNASSASYGADLQHVTLLRTA